MLILLIGTGASIVFASYLAKWDTQKRMKELRAKEKAAREKR